MNRLAFYVAVALCLDVINPIAAQETDRRIITATGTAHVRFKPDAVRIQCGIRTSDLSANAAREATQKSTKALSEILAGLKMKELKMTTSTLNVTQAPELSRFRGMMGGGGPNVIVEPRPYTASQPMTLYLTETDTDKLKESIEKIGKLLIENGANTNGDNIEDNPYFGSRYGASDAPTITLLRRDDSEFRDEALALAVQKALRTANALAKGAGVKIKETVSISEAEITPDNSPIRNLNVNRTISGELEITVRVTVKCSY